MLPLLFHNDLLNRFWGVHGHDYHMIAGCVSLQLQEMEATAELKVNEASK